MIQNYKYNYKTILNIFHSDSLNAEQKSYVSLESGK